MASDEEKARGTKPSGKTNGSGRSQAKGNSRSLSRLTKQRGRVMEWSVWNADALGWLVHCATQSGLALLFGKTRDGGALTLTVYLDGEREVLYINDQEEAERVFEELRRMVDGDDAITPLRADDIPF